MKKALLLLLPVFMALGCSDGETDNPKPETPAANFELSRNAYQFDHEGDDIDVYVESDNPWVAVPAEDVDWMTLDKTSGESGKTKVVIVVAPNESETTRSVVINFTSQEQVIPFTVTQTTVSLTVDTTPIEFEYWGEAKSLAVSSNIVGWSAEIVSSPGWCSVRKERANGVSITTEFNPGDAREAVLRISAGGISREVTLRQVKTQPTFLDKEVLRLQEATIGDGIDIIIMGDGFTAIESHKETGKYKPVMMQAMEHFFSVYPYNAYREYFNVWMVGAISRESGVSVLSPQSSVDTRFDCFWEGSPSTGLDCNDKEVKAYAQVVADMVHKDINEMTVILPINMTAYAGTCIMYEEGLAIAMCTTGSTFKEIVVHEVGGHGFAKLADEYYSSSSGTINQAYAENLQLLKTLGYFANVDMHSAIAQTTWAGFDAKEGYEMVKTFEGGYYFAKGVWRPEEISCMDDNRLYFNAPSRWDVVRRIMKMSGADNNYTVEEFIEDDLRPAVPRSTRAAGEPFVPLAPPILK